MTLPSDRTRPPLPHRRTKRPWIQNRQHLLDLVIYLRHGGLGKDSIAFRKNSNKDISDALSLPLTKVKKILDAHAAGEDVTVKLLEREDKFELTKEQLRDLVSVEALVNQYELGMRSRCALFREKWPGKKLSTKQLRRLFKQHGVVYKVMKPGISLNDKQKRNQAEGRLSCFLKVLPLVENDPEHVFFIDEAVFSSKQAERRVWANKKSLFLVTARNRISFEAVAVVAAINSCGEVI